MANVVAVTRVLTQAVAVPMMLMDCAMHSASKSMNIAWHNRIILYSIYCILDICIIMSSNSRMWYVLIIIV